MAPRDAAPPGKRWKSCAAFGIRWHSSSRQSSRSSAAEPGSALGSMSLSSLRDRVTEWATAGRTGLDWFESGLRTVTGINVFNVPFDTARGWQIYENDRFRVLVIRYEDLACAIPAALRSMFDLDRDPHVPAMNVGGKRRTEEISPLRRRGPLARLDRGRRLRVTDGAALLLARRAPRLSGALGDAVREPAGPAGRPNWWTGTLSLVVTRRASRTERRTEWVRIGQLLAPERARLSLLAVGSFLGGALEAGFLVVVTRTALAIADGDERFEVLDGRTLSVAAAVGIAVVLLIGRLVAALAVLWVSTRVTESVTTRTRRELASAYLRSSWALQHAEPVGRLHELLLSFANTTSSIVSASTTMINASLSLFALAIASLVINPFTTLIFLIGLLVLGAVLAPVRKRIRLRSARAARAQMGFATEVSELGALGMEMQAFGVRDQFAHRIDELIGQNALARRRASFAVGVLSPLFTFLAYGALLGGIAVASAVTSSQLAGIAAVMLVMLRSLSYGQQLQTAIGTAHSLMPYVEMVDVARSRYEDARCDRGRAIEEIGAIVVDSVSFGYDSGQHALHELDFTIEPGEVVGVIGPSGSGKSTWSSCCSAYGTDQRCDQDRRRRPAHDRAQFLDGAGGVRRARCTVALGHGHGEHRFLGDIGDERLRRAAQDAHVADEIESMPDSYLTKVGERGARLSGGQRQRVSIPRALAGDPQLLVMDEPTSALDIRSEALIRQTLRELKGKTTIVIVAHRLSTLKVCDRILILQHGRVVALDRREALAGQDSFFRETLAISGLTA